MGDVELWARVGGLVPIAVIAYYVTKTHRLLPSPAFTLKLVGWAIIALNRVLVLFWSVPLPAMVVASVVAFSAIAAGYFVQYHDLRRVLRRPLEYPETAGEKT